MAVAMWSCKDPETDPTTSGDGPVLTISACDESAAMGGQIAFTANVTDEVTLSTLKVELLFGDAVVNEKSIRTAANGDYSDTIDVPFYKDTADGNATLRFIAQNTASASTTQNKTVAVARPTWESMTLVTEEGTEYAMTKGENFNYSVTDEFPQTLKATIKSPADGNGKQIVFGWANGAVSIEESATAITFTNATAGTYAISLNIKTFEASPFIGLKFGDISLGMIDDDNYGAVATLTNGTDYAVSGIDGFADWALDRDYFTLNEDGSLRFIALTGLYRVKANFAMNYIIVEAMADESTPAKLGDDGTGALWVIGEGIGKPSLANEVKWVTEKAICLAPIGDKKYTLTGVAGVGLNATNINFKFFHQNGWGGEFKAEAITTNSEIVYVGDGSNGRDSGNLGIVEGKKFETGGIYRFTVDCSAGIAAATLSVEKIGEVELPSQELTINGTKMEQLDTDTYAVALDLAAINELTVAGIALSEYWVNPDYFKVSGDKLVLVPIAGKYNVKINVTTKVVTGEVLNANGGAASLGEDCHGALYLLGWGFGSPSLDSQIGWEPTKSYCVPEIGDRIYGITVTTGPEKNSVFGQRLRKDYLDLKFFKTNNWGDIGKLTLAKGIEAYVAITDGGNISLAEGVTLPENATVTITVDLTAGADAPVLNIKM